MTNDRCIGHWPSILSSLGVDERSLRNVHGPCPACGGKDRFRFDDKDGKGTHFCGGCGPGDGYKLVMKMRGIDFKAAKALCEAQLGITAERRAAPRRTRQFDTVDTRVYLAGLWADGKGRNLDAVNAYLASRSIPPLSAADAKVVRYVPRLAWRNDGNQKHGHAPGFIARVYMKGKPVSLHRTYLDTAGPGVRRKMLRGTETLKGAYIPLGGQPERYLGIAEGIETALAARALGNISHFPVWSTIDAGQMAQFRAPAGVEELHIFADRDDTFVGQSAAYNCAYENAKKGVRCYVHIPANAASAEHTCSTEYPSCDYNDVLVRARARESARDRGGREQGDAGSGGVLSSAES